MALQWVQDNIQFFGGDKEAVTVGGESAGAMAILVHLASPASKGLFSKAIVEVRASGLAKQTKKAKQKTFDVLIYIYILTSILRSLGLLLYPTTSLLAPIA